MRVNETSAQKRIWALVLTVMMVIGLLPFNVVAADEVVTAEEPAEGQGSALYGKVTALTGEEYNIVGEVDIEGDETKSVTVTMTKMKLKRVLEDAAIGRPVDGWWAGIRVDAPDEIRGMFWLETTDPDKREWKLQPSYVFQFPDADARSRGIDVKMWLTDLVSGEQITITKPIAFFRTEYTTPTVEFKLSEWPANNTIQVPFGNALAQIGVTADLFKQLSDTDPIPVSKSIGTKVTDDWDGKDGTPAIISLENPHQKEAGNKAVTTPEEDYLKFVFYAGKPDAGKKYKLKLIVTYTVPGADQPTINATIYVPFTFVP